PVFVVDRVGAEERAVDMEVAQLRDGAWADEREDRLEQDSARDDELDPGGFGEAHCHVEVVRHDGDVVPLTQRTGELERRGTRIEQYRLRRPDELRGVGGE